ncbi:MAG: DNA-processing protein DprA [Candidatus Eremiobacteraeota bacterium]|nr:DNA-processing protein DprA [Candidatus Eremiobacteraeota bacterium]
MSSNLPADFPLPDGQVLRQLRARLILRGDPDFPVGLRDLPDPPRFLTVLGHLPLQGVAIVGSRTPSKEAEEFTFLLARSIREPVISGLATGIDTAAHRGALAGDNPTLAYVGNGIATVYPPQNAPLAARIVASGGGVASAEMSHDEVTDAALVRRDSFQAAHARAVVLVCSESNGGAMHTIRFARQLRRPTFALTAQDGPEFAGNREALCSGAVALPWNVKGALRVLHGKMSELNDATSL